MMGPTLIQIASEGSHRWVKVSGPATLKVSPTFLACLEHLSDESAEEICVVLADCAWLDSTFAGCLIGFDLNKQKVPRPRLYLSSPSKRCRDALRQMNLDVHLKIKEQSPPASLNWQEFAQLATGDKELGRVVIRAHEQLAEADPRNEEFGHIADAFKQDQARDQGD